MKIDVLTLFPQMFTGVFTESILGKAREKGIVTLQTWNFREYANNKHNTVDDYPYGGGGGMVLRAEPIFAAVAGILDSSKKAKHSNGLSAPRVILLCPQGETFTQKKAESLAEERHLVFICGHYEGFDERIRERLVTDEISIGDYVLTGGEIPAMTVIDSVVRLLPGVLGNKTSAMTDSFSTGLLEYPQYTRPAIYQDMEVPEVLLSGHHEQIASWRRKQSLFRTWQRRPDLLEQRNLLPEEKQWIADFEED